MPCRPFMGTLIASATISMTVTEPLRGVTLNASGARTAQMKVATSPVRLDNPSGAHGHDRRMDCETLVRVIFPLVSSESHSQRRDLSRRRLVHNVVPDPGDARGEMCAAFRWPHQARVLRLGKFGNRRTPWPNLSH